MTQINQHVKFRWTENLTSRFIFLRKENDKLFTGRKYSAQAGWEYILRHMKQEFPTIMADVPFRVLKKKWSNLLQQYKELKNPVHGDKNKVDDISWPFYNAIDEIVLGQDHHKSMKRENSEQPIYDIEEEEVDPHEFLCVSVTPPDEQISPSSSSIETNFFLQNHDQKYYNDDTTIQQIKKELPKSRINDKFISTNIHKNMINESRMIHEKQLKIIQTAVNHAKRSRKESSVNINYKKIKKNQDDNINNSIIINKINEYLDYTKKRDEENKLIMLKILSAVEKISEKLN